MEVTWMNIFSIARELGASPWLIAKLLLRTWVAVTVALSPIGTTRKVKVSGGKVQFRLDCGVYHVRFYIRNSDRSPSRSKRGTKREEQLSLRPTEDVVSISTATITERTERPVPVVSSSVNTFGSQSNAIGSAE
jgi:hypothetical protein